MKKVALSLAGLLAVAAFAPEASALPVFARQTGMACNACHFQHFPLLNSFGRSFKASGFTLMGAQGKVEGEGLSLPAEVNAAVLTSMGYEKTNALRIPGSPLTMSAGGAFTGGFFVAAESGEASLFLGGRGSDFMGFLTEITAGNGAAAVDSFKTPILVDVGGPRVGIVPFTTNGQGASYGFETMNTGANAIHSISNTVGFQSQYINAISAQQYIGTGAAATGAAVVATSDMGFINVTKFVQAGPAAPGALNLGNPISASLSSTYARLAFLTDLGGWDSGIGVQSWSGQSVSQAALGGLQASKATAVDAQMQGTIAGMPTGFYLTYAKAPLSTGTTPTNAFNACVAPAVCFAKSSFNIAGEVGVVPEKVTVGAAIRRAKAGFADANGANATDNAWYLTATYKLAQNLLTRFSYVSQSGSAWNAAATQTLGSKSWTVNLYALF